MLCRLCLCNLKDAVAICIFSSEPELPKVIAKYLQLQLTLDDAVSSKLCTTCWRLLTEFDEFCSMVAAKQQTLLLKTEPEPPPEPAVVVWNTESPIETKLAFDDDVKDHILCEPEIDVNDREAAGNDDSGSFSSGHELQLEPEQDSIATELESNYTKGRTRQATRLVVARAESLLKSNVKTKAKTKPKRGRPKGRKTKSKVKQPPNETETSLVQPRTKRHSVKDMDEFIAANVKLVCCLCTAPLKDFIDLKRHFRAEHNCTGYMECCNNRYKKRTLYVDHLHYHKDPQYFSCKPCLKSFLNRNSQDMHMLRFHSDQQELVHECAICQAKFAKKFLLTMHFKGHKGTERTEACETCSKTFRTKLELTAHIKRMHTADFTPVICDICGVNFRSKANFLIHKKSLHPEGPVAEVQCSLCSRWLRDERSLRKHMARHDDREGNNKYRCVLCGAEKASRVALSSHMRYHHSGKRHSCTLCGKEFKLPRALAEHMATHTGIDLYSCAFCPRTFKSHANMHNHKKKMHPNEWVRKYTQPSAAAKSASVPGEEDAIQQQQQEQQQPQSRPQEEDDTQQSVVTSVSYEFMSNSSVCPV
ncbi:CG11696 [Drosophila busckii]|uniref:CG11696 n=1 Tax=Drosophila busckii TaxID=30019 RepID=A0A0M3QZ58_DROBS|nr:transcription factor grauzone [Drosophila busckii]ALC48853.1 CG11696 [Drosophila busckii]